MAKKKYSTQTEALQDVGEDIVDYPAMPRPTQITVNIEDTAMLKEIKQAIRMIRGVVSIEKSPAQKSYERARADVAAGRVVECRDKQEFFAKLGI